MEVKKAVGTKSKTTSEIDLELSDALPETIKAKVKRDVGEFLVERVLSSLRNAETPVKGEGWPALSKEYKAKKKAEGLPGEPNMELEGDMLDALTFEETSDGVEIGFFGAEAWKADGHLKFSGKENNTPQRRFLPGEGQEFDAEITRKAEQIIADAIAENADFDKSVFEDVASKSDLYEVLAEFFPDMSRAEIRSAVTRAPALIKLLDELDLIDLL